MIQNKLAISIVLYQINREDFFQLINSLQEQEASDLFEVYLWDNSSLDHQKEVQTWIAEKNFGNQFSTLIYEASKENLGFGKAHNSNFKKVTNRPYILILNQDIKLLKNSVEVILQTAENDTSEVGAWELRQIPYEHPKIYNPSTLETEWVTGAACLFRKTALDLVQGFDTNIFMYAEDVDISWRLRANGYKCKYIPKAAVFHYTYSAPNENKPTQMYEGTLTNMLLRVKFGSWLQIIKSPILLCIEIFLPTNIVGRRLALLKLLPRYIKNVIKFRKAGKAYRQAFKPTFMVWDYSLHREGAFYPFDDCSLWSYHPKVSIIIRTMDRAAALNEALASVANQTYPNIEVIVVEDGPATSQSVIDSYKDQLDLKYYPLGKNIGRSYAGNKGLSEASGEWFNFLDDDDQFFADHIEVLLKKVMQTGHKGAYGLAWEIPTTIIDISNWKYIEHDYQLIWSRKFSRLLIWHTNFLPIQTVLFHRSLYEQYGGFDISLDVLEDWDLWIRYTFKHDFIGIEKITSKYRVPADKETAQKRLAPFEKARERIENKQAKLGMMEVDIATLKQMVSEYQKNEMLLSISKHSVGSMLKKTAFGRFLLSHKIFIKKVYTKIKFW